MKSLASAIQFLTVVRIPGKPAAPGEAVSMGRAAAWFPLVGAALGAAGGGMYLVALRALPAALAALACVAFWTAASGVLHEDGLADVADALRAGRSRETMLAILKDSRIGTFGAVAVVLSLLARWQALQYFTASSFNNTGILAACVAAQAVPRAAMVGLAWTSRPVGAGLGYAFASTLTTPAALAALVQGALAALLCGPRAGVIIVLGAFVIARLARTYFYHRLGGVNGDCLGATEQLIEIFILGLFACRTCSW
jgi:adenosylcobinamide-GDP ribazoletransferase